MNTPPVWLPAIVISLWFLGGCAGTPPSDRDFRNAYCSDQWQSLQQRLDDEGIRDAQAVAIPGTPMLRVTRELASFDLGELAPAQRLEWLRRALEEGRAGVQSEASRLDDPPSLAPLMRCAETEIELIAYDDERWAELIEGVSVPDAYHHWRRAVGLFPLMRPAMRWQVRRLETYLESQYRSYEPEGEWQRYTPAHNPEARPATEEILSRARARSALGQYRFNEHERQLLLQRHAPILEVETLGSHDRPGSPEWRDGRWEITPPVRAYTQVTATRWQGEWVPQLVYHFWFDERPKDHPLDIYGGRLDGLIWRVTLDSSGDILLYDSVHPCGCYLRWHPVEQRLALKPDAPDDGIMTMMPVSLPEKRPGPPLVRLQSATHYLVDIRHQAESSDTASEPYSLAPYDQLRSIPGDNGRRSLFGPDGLVPDTQRLERFLLWNTGVPSPGAMRQWGHHATSFLGTRHFDDPDLLARYFKPQ